MTGPFIVVALAPVWGSALAVAFDLARTRGPIARRRHLAKCNAPFPITDTDTEGASS